MEIAWGELRRKERDTSAGRAWMGYEAWKQLIKGGNSLGGAPQEGARQECRTSVHGTPRIRLGF